MQEALLLKPFSKRQSLPSSHCLSLSVVHWCTYLAKWLSSQPTAGNLVFLFLFLAWILSIQNSAWSQSALLHPSAFYAWRRGLTETERQACWKLLNLHVPCLTKKAPTDGKLCLEPSKISVQKARKVASSSEQGSADSKPVRHNELG